jgi:predicted acetyltransferase
MGAVDNHAVHDAPVERQELPNPRERTMIAGEEVVLEPATPADATVLSNLLELYIHDMSEIFPIEVGAAGRFGYDRLPLYWSEPETRFPFLIRAGAHIAGFALVTRGSPVTDNPDYLDVAEFFILRRHRRSGVGRQAARLLWDRIPGQWVVRVSEANRAGIPFWEDVIRTYTSGAFSDRHRPGTPHGWRVFSFKSPIEAAGVGKGIRS